VKAPVYSRRLNNMMFMERKPPTPRRIKSQAASHSSLFPLLT
jgi:hypothetical protein